MSEHVRDPQSGISIRFIKQFDMTTERPPSRFDVCVDEFTAASWLASVDPRDVPFSVKLATALRYIREAPEL